MKIRKIGVLMLIVMLLGVFTSGCGSQKNAASKSNGSKAKIKVGFIYNGAPGDAGWTYAHDQARKYLIKQVPGVQTLVMQNVAEGADAERDLEQLAQQGCKVIFANSFGYGDAVMAVAKKYPNVQFLHCSGTKTAGNVSTYFGTIEQARYLSGMIAGSMTKKNTIGYVAAFPIPEVIRGINSFTLGAQSVNPNIKVKVAWTNTWFDQTKEKEAAQGLIAAGCDVLTQHQDSPSTQQAAEEAKIYSVGYNSDMSKFAPDANLTSPVWNWGPFYVKTVKAVLNGTFKGGFSYVGSLKDGLVGLAPISSKVPAAVKQKVEAKKAEMVSGTFDPFTGPITAQDGTIKVPAGSKYSWADQLTMDWFVQGVEGKITKTTQE